MATISITQANSSTDGYLSSADWNTFNDKVSSNPSIAGVAGATAVANMVFCTRTAYDAGTPDADTYYIIDEDN